MRQPSRASRWAIARPKPLAAPVMIALRRLSDTTRIVLVRKIHRRESLQADEIGPVLAATTPEMNTARRIDRYQGRVKQRRNHRRYLTISNSAQ
jgi:hypothetical protein